MRTKYPKKMLRTLSENGLAVPFDDEFETILICAHRYAMGRSTYMPPLVGYTRPLLPRLSDRFLSIFLDDIEFQKRFSLGDYYNKQSWLQFEADVRAEQERRKHGGSKQRQYSHGGYDLNELSVYDNETDDQPENLHTEGDQAE